MSNQITPMQELKHHIQNMVDNGGDYDLLCVIGMIDEIYLPKEEQVIKDAFIDSIFYMSEGTVDEMIDNYYNTKFKQNDTK